MTDFVQKGPGQKPLIGELLDRLKVGDTLTVPAGIYDEVSPSNSPKLSEHVVGNDGFDPTGAD